MKFQDQILDTIVQMVGEGITLWLENNYSITYKASGCGWLLGG